MSNWLEVRPIGMWIMPTRDHCPIVYNRLMHWALNVEHWTLNTYLLGLQIQLKYADQMSFIGFLNPNDWKSDYTNNDACKFTWSRDQLYTIWCCTIYIVLFDCYIAVFFRACKLLRVYLLYTSLGARWWNQEAGSLVIACDSHMCLSNGFQQSVTAVPAPLFKSFCCSTSKIWNASLIMSVLLFLVWSKISISFQKRRCCFAQACFGMADFFVSPHLMTAWCSFTQVSGFLLVSPMYCSS